MRRRLETLGVKIPLGCIECSRARGRNDDGTWPAVFFLVDLENDGVYVGQCSEGHEFAIVLQ